MPRIVNGNAVDSALDTIHAEIQNAASHGRSSVAMIVPLLSHEDNFSLATREEQSVAVSALFARCNAIKENLEGDGFEVDVAPNMMGRWGCSIYVRWPHDGVYESIESWKASSN